MCSESLAKDVVEHILNVRDFKSLKKARAIEKILRNTAPVSQLERLMVCISDGMDIC
jgi:hypothetical protein